VAVQPVCSLDPFAALPHPQVLMQALVGVKMQTLTHLLIPVTVQVMVQLPVPVQLPVLR